MSTILSLIVDNLDIYERIIVVRLKMVFYFVFTGASSFKGTKKIP